MPILHLGVNDIPYNEPAPEPKRVAKARKGAKPRGRRVKNSQTTGDVAEILEAKYGVMQAFYDANADDIANAFAHGIAGAIEDLFAGAPMRDPFAEINSEVTAGFKQWLLQGKIEELGIPGVPTKAALKRRSLRFKKKRGPNRRPSFIDTGTYEGSFQAWVDK